MISTTLTGNLGVYYDKVFLDRAKYLLVHDTYAQKRSVPANGGRVAYFNRMEIPAVNTTAHTEITNPTAINPTGVLVTATLYTYASYEQVSIDYDRMAIDRGLKENIETMGDHYGASMDTLVRNAMLGATVLTQWASGIGGGVATTCYVLSNIVASDTLDVKELRIAARTLSKNKAPQIQGTLGSPVYGGLIGPECAYDLMADSNFQAMQQYVTPDNAKRGILGTVAGVECVRTNNNYIYGTPAYATFVMGANALGVVTIDNEDAMSKNLILKDPGTGDTSNPANLWSTIAWKATMAAQVINSNWIVQIYSGTTA
jgi:N4-gp56 family major capsid protein